MVEILSTVALIIHLVASTGLFIYGINCYVVLGLFFRKHRPHSRRQQARERAFLAEIEGGRELPPVTIQVPLYNEYNVAERVMRACAAIDYPRDLFELQVLDDSTDETRDLVDSVAAELEKEGTRVSVFRREIRSGFKAGALKEGLQVAKGDFIAIFDSDFVPPVDFLKRLLAHIVDNPEVGLAQARWGHLNRDANLLTRAQAIGIDGHFAIEQPARSWNDLFLNFNGTAGLWRREAIDEAGGWEADTLTEDMDLSYRSQLVGWKIEYVLGLECPAELPETYRAFKSQQFRWAKGSIQTTMKLIGRVFRSDASVFAKFQSIFHFTHYAIHPLMLTIAIFSVFTIYQLPNAVPVWIIGLLALPLVPAMIAPSLLYLISQVVLYPTDWPRRILMLPFLLCVGFGLCLSNSRAVWEAITGRKSAFIRTPKAGDGSAKKSYKTKLTAAPLIELGLATWCAASVVITVTAGHLGFAPFLTCYAIGFFIMGSAGLREN